MEEKLIDVGLYADSTNLFSESECDSDNSCSMLFPEWIVRRWYEENEGAKEVADELDIPLEEATMELWLKNVYTFDSTDGLYEFAVENGVTPTFGIGGHHYVFYRTEENYKYIVFEGDYDQCRRYMAECNFRFGFDPEDEHGYELEVE